MLAALGRPSSWTDVSQLHPDPEVRLSRPTTYVALMTPVDQSRAVTDMGFDRHRHLADAGPRRPRIHPRMGPRAVRARRPHCTQIYEGTNGIQALDLVGRKLGQDAGRLLRRFFHPVSAWLEAHAEDAGLAEFAGPTAKAFARLQQATMTVAQRGMSRPEEAAAAATDYLRLFNLVAMAFMWCRMAEVAGGKLRARRQRGRRVLPEQAGRGPLLHGSRAAPALRPLPGRDGRRRDAGADGGRGVLSKPLQVCAQMKS